MAKGLLHPEARQPSSVLAGRDERKSAHIRGVDRNHVPAELRSRESTATSAELSSGAVWAFTVGLFNAPITPATVCVELR